MPWVGEVKEVHPYRSAAAAAAVVKVEQQQEAEQVEVAQAVAAAVAAAVRLLGVEKQMPLTLDQLVA